MKQFLQTFKGSYVQTFDDTKSGKSLTRSMPMEEAKGKVTELVELNKQGAGIFFTPNPCTGGRKAEHVTAIKWVFVDMDEGTKEQMMNRIKESPIKPSIIVESSRSYHCYWRCTCTEPQFNKIITGLIDYFDGDKAISSTNEVLRFPGFYHMKDMGSPFKIKIISFEDKEITPSEMISAFPSKIQHFKHKHSLKESDLRIIKDIPIKAVLARLGVEVSRDNFIMEGGKVTSASINVNGNYVHRFSGKAGSGSTIDVVMAFGKLDLTGAIKWLKDFAGIKEVFEPKDCIDELDEELEDLTYTMPFTWGTVNADKEITPIQPHHFNVFGGEQGSGKTAYSFFMAKENANLGHKVLYISLEMSGSDIIKRIARSFAGITKEQWRVKKLITPTQRNAYTRKKKEIHEIKNLMLAGFDTDEPTTENIHKLIDYSNASLVFIDNLDLVAVEDNENPFQAQARITRFFMNFAKAKGIPIIMLHHYNKKSKSSEGRGLDSFRGSAKITHNASTVVVGRRFSEDNATNEDKATYSLYEQKDREFGIGGACNTYFYKGDFYDEYRG